MDALFTLIILGYSIWGFYVGRKFLSGRFAWLEKQKPLNKIVKFILSVIVGFYIGVAYFIYSVVKLVCR